MTPIAYLDVPGEAPGRGGARRATATFVAPKLGFAAPGAGDYTGEVAVIDIGLPRCLLRPFEVDTGHGDGGPNR